MAIVSRKVINSTSETSTSADQNPSVTLKTWNDLIHYMNIDPVVLPWNVDGATALRILRDKYGTTLRELHDASLDEAIRLYAADSYLKQLQALGTALNNLELSFCLFNHETDENYAFIRKEENKSEWNKRLAALKNKASFGYRTFWPVSLDRDESLDASTNPIQIPMSRLQVTNTFFISDTDHTVVEHFLVWISLKRFSRMALKPICWMPWERFPLKSSPFEPPATPIVSSRSQPSPERNAMKFRIGFLFIVFAFCLHGEPLTPAIVSNVWENG